MALVVTTAIMGDIMVVTTSQLLLANNTTLGTKHIIQNPYQLLEVTGHPLLPSVPKVVKEPLKCLQPTEEKVAGENQLRNDSASLPSAKAHPDHRDHQARTEFQEETETREPLEHQEEGDLQGHLVPMALLDHQG